MVAAELSFMCREILGFKFEPAAGSSAGQRWKGKIDLTVC